MYKKNPLGINKEKPINLPLDMLKLKKNKYCFIKISKRKKKIYGLKIKKYKLKLKHLIELNKSKLTKDFIKISTFNSIRKLKLILMKLILKQKYKNKKQIKKKYFKKKYSNLYSHHFNLDFFKMEINQKKLFMKFRSKFHEEKYKIKFNCRLNFHLNKIQKKKLQYQQLKSLTYRYKKIFWSILIKKMNFKLMNKKNKFKNIFYKFMKNIYKKNKIDFTFKVPFSSFSNFNTSLAIYKNQNVLIFNNFLIDAYYLCRFKELLNFQMKIYVYMFFYFIFFRVNNLIQDNDTFSSNFGRLYSAERGLFPGVPEYYRTRIRKYKFLCEKTFNRIIA